MVTATLSCLPFFYKENSDELISGLILVDVYPVYWYCWVLFLNSFFQKKKHLENEVTDQGLPFLEIEMA